MKLKNSRSWRLWCWRNQEDEVSGVVIETVRHICKCTLYSVACLHQDHIERQFLSQLWNRIFIHTWANQTNQMCPLTEFFPEMKNVKVWSAASIPEFQLKNLKNNKHLLKYNKSKFTIPQKFNFKKTKL